MNPIATISALVNFTAFVTLTLTGFGHKKTRAISTLVPMEIDYYSIFIKYPHSLFIHIYTSAFVNKTININRQKTAKQIPENNVIFL